MNTAVAGDSLAYTGFNIITGCKESHFYSLPFGQAVLAYKPFSLAQNPF